MILILVVIIGMLIKFDKGLDNNIIINNITNTSRDPFIEYYEEYGTNMRVLGVNYSSMNIIPQVDYFIESMSYESNLLDEEMRKLYLEFKGNITFYPRYIISKNLSNNDSCYDKGNFCSSEGIKELFQDVRELCVYYYIGLEEYYSFVILTNRLCTLEDIETCWVNATEIIGINTSEVNNCLSDDSRSIMLDERRITLGALKITKPKIFINAKPYNKTINYSILKESLCDEYNISVRPNMCEKPKSI